MPSAPCLSAAVTSPVFSRRSVPSQSLPASWTVGPSSVIRRITNVSFWNLGIQIGIEGFFIGISHMYHFLAYINATVTVYGLNLVKGYDIRAMDTHKAR